MLRALVSENFPPFGKMELEFPVVANKPADLAEVQLLTGVNGTGKTRVLSLLAAMLGNAEPLRRRLKGLDGEVIFFSTHEKRPFAQIVERGHNRYVASAQSQGHFQTGGPIADWMPSVPAFAYSGGAYVQDANVTVMAAVPKPKREVCLSFIRPPDHSQMLLQALTNLKMQAAMENLDGEVGGVLAHRSMRIITGLESAITTITNMPFKFGVTAYPEPRIGVVWGGNRFAFDVLPDGLRSIIGWLVHAVVMLDAWLQGKGDPVLTETVFLLDEIESHLHPAWQRRVLPAFQKLFPASQIFVATHSPFVIASVNHGWIHSLTPESGGIVRAQKPVAASEGDSYISVLEEIMGVREWYDPETEGLLGNFRQARDNAYKGDAQAAIVARELGAKIATRSMELGYLMGKELAQFERQMTKRIAK